MNYWVFTQAGIQRLLNGGRTYLNSGVVEAGLYKTAHTPLSTDSLATFAAIECDFGGYARQLTSSWGAPSVNANPPDQDMSATALVFIWGSGSANTIYGVFLYDTSDNALLCAMSTNLSVPAVLDAVGKSYSFTPRLTGAPYAGYP